MLYSTNDINLFRKLNQKSQALAMLQSELEEREELLEEREQDVVEREQHLELNQASVQRAKEVMNRLQGVEIEVEEKFRLLREVKISKLSSVFFLFQTCVLLLFSRLWSIIYKLLVKYNL